MHIRVYELVIQEEKSDLLYQGMLEKSKSRYTRRFPEGLHVEVLYRFRKLEIYNELDNSKDSMWTYGRNIRKMVGCEV